MLCLLLMSAWYSRAGRATLQILQAAGNGPCDGKMIHVTAHLSLLSPALSLQPETHLIQSKNTIGHMGSPSLSNVGSAG